MYMSCYLKFQIYTISYIQVNFNPPYTRDLQIRCSFYFFPYRKIFLVIATRKKDSRNHWACLN